MLMNILGSNNLPRLVGVDGVEQRTSFNLNGTEVNKSCGVTFRNRYIIFGGQVNKRQILEVGRKSCVLKVLDSELDFDFTFGACSVTPDDDIYLCFHDHANENRKCRKTTWPRNPFKDVGDAQYGHTWTRIAASSGW